MRRTAAISRRPGPKRDFRFSSPRSRNVSNPTSRNASHSSRPLLERAKSVRIRRSAVPAHEKSSYARTSFMPRRAVVSRPSRALAAHFKSDENILDSPENSPPHHRHRTASKTYERPRKRRTARRVVELHCGGMSDARHVYYRNITFSFFFFFSSPVRFLSVPDPRETAAHVTRRSCGHWKRAKTPSGDGARRAAKDFRTVVPARLPRLSPQPSFRAKTITKR